MNIPKETLIAVLGQFNPWWRSEAVPDLPTWRRAAFGELTKWIMDPPVARAIFIAGARQVGKTTLLMQSIQHLIDNKIPVGNILYATFDHPILKFAGIDAVLEVWRERIPKCDGLDFLFLDEAQFVPDYATWIKHQVDFVKQRRIIFTGSAMPMIQIGQESGLGRWHTIRLTTLSFYEYLHLRAIQLPPLITIRSLKELFAWSDSQLKNVAEQARRYTAHFHEYLLHGGFPQTAVINSITQSQKLLREDIIDRSIKRDMTAFFGVRRILEFEQTFLYLCRHDGGILDMGALCSNLQITRPTAQRFIDQLEATHLVYRLLPFGYGKEVLRGRYKIYLADAAIAPAVMVKGHFIDDPTTLGIAAESSVLKHLFTRYYQQNLRFTYWRKKDQKVDLVAEVDGQIIPFEVKYRSDVSNIGQFKGLIAFCRSHKVDRGYIITKSPDDLGLMKQDKSAIPLFRIPATLLCYWMGEMELKQQMKD